MTESEPESPVVDQVQWVFQTLERIHAGESIPPDEVASHFAPEFLKACPPEQILAGYRDVAPAAAQIAMLRVEFDRDFEEDRSRSLVATLDDGSRSRWWFNVEADPPHRILGQLWTGPLPASTDQVIAGQEADVLVRTYDDTGSGSGHILLLHPFGADVGCWDMVVPRIDHPATVRALDLRGHGRSDAHHGYSARGCFADIATATHGMPSSDLVLVGHSLGGWVALEYAARTPCRALITFDGPAGLTLGLSEDDIAAAPEPLKSVYADHNTTDVASIVADLTTPALFVLCREHHEQVADQMRTRQQLAEHATRHGHTVRWVDAGHGFAVEQPELSGQIITDFLATIGG